MTSAKDDGDAVTGASGLCEMTTGEEKPRTSASFAAYIKQPSQQVAEKREGEQDEADEQRKLSKLTGRNLPQCPDEQTPRQCFLH